MSYVAAPHVLGIPTKFSPDDVASDVDIEWNVTIINPDGSKQYRLVMAPCEDWAQCLALMEAYDEDGSVQYGLGDAIPESYCK